MDAVDPDMDTNRYLILTRDSGDWSSDASYNSGQFGWGWVNYGGIYIDNDTDIQYQHDLEKLRLNWVGSYGVPGADGRTGTVAPGNWWDKTGRYYAPPGVEIILHGEATCPYVEIIRDDLRVGQGGVKYYWQDLNGAPIPYDRAEPTQYAPPSGRCEGPIFGFKVEVQGARARFPYPPNGIIYSEGNVRIRGDMPRNRGGGQYFPTDPTDASQRDLFSRMPRNHDLQVVSGGTIYVEGDLLGPSSAGLYRDELGTSPGVQELMEWDRDYGSRLALIARDHVCLNTTAFHPRPANLYSGGETQYNDDQPIYPDPETNGYPPYLLFQGTREETVNDDSGALANHDRQVTDPAGIEFLYNNVRLQTPSLRGAAYLSDLRLIMGHSGWYTPRDPATGVPGDQTALLGHREAAVEVELRVNGTVRPWQNGGATYMFRSEGNEPEDGSAHWYLEPDRSDPFNAANPCDYLEWLPRLQPVDSLQAMDGLGLTGRDRLGFGAWITPVWNEDPNNPQWIIKPRELGYALGPLAITPLRGQDPMLVRVEAMVYAQNGSWFILPGPWFNEDPDSTIDVTELQQEAYPTYHEPLNVQISFSGAISENLPAPVGEVADWTSKWSGPFGTTGHLTYEYDPLLRWATRADSQGRWYPRFPGLLLTPDLLIWGERVSGFTGAGV
jgi:hypothetical protein